MDKIKDENLAEQNIIKLKELFPAAFTEGEMIDFDVLKTILGENIDEKQEKYQFTWNGKMNSIRFAQQPSTGTLIPDKESSKKWDTTENLYIEGDNLEVLKLLQKTYFGKIKMIYIDPPYNTGGDFVYKDNFKDSINSYKEITKQNLKSNPETSGRYHTDWLNMIYPRLMLAKNLLTDDGVIFISIDSNEVDNLKKVCNEIFGENNCLAIISTINNLKGRSDDKFFATCNEFLLVYSKNVSILNIGGFDLDDEELDNDYEKQDEIGFYKPIGFRKTGAGWERINRPYMFYPVLFKDSLFSTISNEEFSNLYNRITNQFDDNYMLAVSEKYEELGYKVIFPTNEAGEYGRWRWGRETFSIQKDINLTFNSAGTICTKMRATIEDGSIRVKTAKTFWYKPEYDTGSGAKILKQLFGNSSDIFNNPKSLVYIKDILKISTCKYSLILDFFAGSATTAHAVMQLNAEDGGNRKFIMVQLPEKTDEKSEAFKAGYSNLCDIGKERIRRAGDKIVSELKKTSETLFTEGSEKKQLDIGFKVFKLDSSNLTTFEGTKEGIQASLDFETIIRARSDKDVLYEIMLKYGVFDKSINEIKIEDKTVYSVGAGYLLVCLDKNITDQTVNEIAKLKPRTVIFDETGFKDDNAKDNAIYALLKAGVEEIKSI